MAQVLDGISRRVFQFVHSNNLVYNTCWEDPRLDREAMTLSGDDRVMVITSAGCNALDYALDGPEHISCVDVNPRQNALLELKMAGIRKLDYPTFFKIFGEGRHRDFYRLYNDRLRPSLSHEARAIWDRKADYFVGTKMRPTFYYRGTAGLLARIMLAYTRWLGVRDRIHALFSAESVEQQRELYHRTLGDDFWRGSLRWFLGRDTTLSLMGIPRKQRRLVEQGSPGGIAQFIRECIEAVFTRLPLNDNYFWWVYFIGGYTPERCPEYLKEESFERLKDGLVDRISTHTTTVANFLETSREPVSRFVLLDHMDWMAAYAHPALQQEWQAIIDRATPGARILWRSGGPEVDFVDPIPVTVKGRASKVGEHLEYHHELASELHRRDRVHTYASFTIADLQS